MRLTLLTMREAAKDPSGKRTQWRLSTVQTTSRLLMPPGYECLDEGFLERETFSLFDRNLTPLPPTPWPTRSNQPRIDYPPIRDIRIGCKYISHMYVLDASTELDAVSSDLVHSIHIKALQAAARQYLEDKELCILRGCWELAERIRQQLTKLNPLTMSAEQPSKTQTNKRPASPQGEDDATPKRVLKSLVMLGQRNDRGRPS